jgi:PAS domain S-box-containing protein
MLARIRTLLSPPIFAGDEDKTRIARQVHFILLLLLGGAAAYTLALPWLAPERTNRLWLVAPLFLLFGALFIINRRGHARPAGGWLIAGLWLVLTVAAATSEGIRSPAAPVYVIVVLYTGLLFGPRAALGAAGWSVLTGVALVSAEAAGFLSTSGLPASPLTFWLAQAMTFVWAVGLFYLALRDVREALAQAHRELVERQRAEGELRASEARFRAVVENISETIALLGADGAIRYISPAIIRISGYAPEERLGRSGFELIHPDDLPVARRVFAELIGQPGARAGLEVRARGKDGAWRWIETNSHNLLADPSVGAVIVSFRDITARKQTEARDRHRHGMLEKVVHLGKDITQTTDLRECLWRIHQSLQTGLGFDRAGIYLYDPRGHVLRGSFGTNRTGELQEEWQEVIVVADDESSRRLLDAQAGFIHTDDYATEHHIDPASQHQMAGVKEHADVAAWAGDTPKAVLWVDNLVTERPMTDEQLEALRLFAGYAGLAIAHAQSHAALHRSTKRQEILHEIDRAILAAHSLEDIAAAALPRIRTLVPCERVSLLLFDETAQQVVVVAVNTDRETYMDVGQRRPLQDVRSATGLRDRSYVLVDDIATLTEHSLREDEMLAEGLRARLSLPLRASGQLIGSLNLAAAQPGAFMPEDIEVGGEVADQIAIAIQHLRLLAETTEALAREERLNEIARVISSALDPEVIISTVVRLAAELLGAESCSAYLVSADGQTLTTRYAFNYPDHFPQPPFAKANGGLNWLVVETGRPLRLERHADHPQALALWADIQAFICAPIIAGETPIGTLTAFNLNPDKRFSERDLALMESIGRQAGIAIQNARLFDAEQRRVALLTAVRETELDISTQLELPTLLRVILERARRLIGASMGSLYLMRPDQTLEVVVNQNIPGVVVGTRLQMGEGLSGRVAQAKEPMLIADYSQWPGRAAVFEHVGVHAVFAVPILWQEEVLGAINLLDERPGRFGPDDVESVRLLAAQAAIAIRNAQLFEATRRQLKELTVLHRVALASVEAENEDNLIERVTRLIGETFFAEDFGVLLVDFGRGALRVHPSYHGPHGGPKIDLYPLGEHIVGAVAASGRPWRLPDVSREPSYYPAYPEARSELCVPLKVGEQVIGVINTESSALDAFSEDAERLLVTLAGQLAIGIERLRGQANEARRRRWLEKVVELGKTASQIANLRSCLMTIHDSVQHGLEFDRVGLFLYDAPTRTMRGTFGTDASGARIDISAFVGSVDTYLGFRRLMDTPTELLYAPDFAAAYAQRDADMEGVKEHVMMAAWAGDQPVAVITADNRLTQRPMLQEQLEALRLFAGYAGLAIQNARWNEELERRVSERTAQLQESEAALRRTEDLYRRAIAAADAVPYERQYAREVFSFIGEGILNLTGYTAQEMTAALWDTLPQEIIMRGEASGLTLPEAVRRARAGEFQRWRADYRIHARDGRTRWVADASVEVRDNAGQPVGSIGILTDVTDRRRDEQRIEIVGHILRQLNATPQVAEVFSSIGADLRTITGCQRISLILFDATHEWYTAAFLYPAHEEPRPGVRTRIVNQIFIQNLLAGRPHVVGDLRQQAVSPVEATLLDMGYRSILSLPLRRQSDTIGALNLTWREPEGYHDADQLMLDQIASALALALERSRLFDEVQERAKELEAANRELESFSYSVSHDLRSPLRAIDGFSRLLLEEHGANLNPDGRRYLNYVRNGALGMSQLIDDLLDFSRFSRQPIRKQTVHPAELARRVLDELRLNYTAQAVEVHIGNLPVCQADPTLLRQVFINLLDNALKYSRQRDVAQIEVGWTGEAYFVRDNGAGFDMRYANKLFGVFQRMHSADEFEGTGVGLAIVNRILQRHGGRIWAEAEVNQGATFFFTLAAE